MECPVFIGIRHLSAEAKKARASCSISRHGFALTRGYAGVSHVFPLSSVLFKEGFRNLRQGTTHRHRHRHPLGSAGSDFRRDISGICHMPCWGRAVHTRSSAADRLHIAKTGCLCRICPATRDVYMCPSPCEIIEGTYLVLPPPAATVSSTNEPPLFRPTHPRPFPMNRPLRP